ncbi:PREDICTED: protein CYR61-like, partial [Nicrophorus vespilloides]|uniref:Protein CYR61-like n=1 Tax=Nicrophorus vespilloides TaxID=110193 RepID=A0ABM1MQP2_NICVS
MLLGTALVLLLSLSGTISGGRHRRKDLVRLRRSIINEKCPYPCTCPTKEVCEECEECPRQLDEPCSDDRPCDRFKGLVCAFLHDGDTEGVCRADTSGVPCVVYNKTYRHGETFSPDCRTQCACQNGTYGCSSLCPQEHISPEGSCRHPRLVELPGQCCREWMCDSQAVEEPPSCEPTFTKWSECSSNCGSGISTRRSNLNGRCESAVEARICQTRRCDANEVFTHRSHHHHLR